MLNVNGMSLCGVVFDEYYPDGTLKECLLTQKNTIVTSFGTFIAQYKDDGVRKKLTPSLSFYQSGALRKIALQAQTAVNTPVGILPAELITFYESGALLRVFPLNGKLSGYWTEQNEYNLAAPIRLSLPFGNIESKLICIHFYESGTVKSITLWPQEKPTIQTPCGMMSARIGISFYEDGTLRSIEPARPTTVKTPIGVITAFDIEVVGITGDNNSLQFSQNGDIVGLKTGSEQIRVTDKDCFVKTYSPALVRSHFSDDHPAVKPLSMRFDNDLVFFNGENTGYSIKDISFEILPFRTKESANNCKGCG